MNTIINLPYQIGQKLYIVQETKQFVRTEEIFITNTPNFKKWTQKNIYKNIQIVVEKYLKEIQIDEEGICWTFADNSNLTDNDEWDEDHHYEWYRDNEINIFTDKVEAEDYALSINVMNELCK